MKFAFVKRVVDCVLVCLVAIPSFLLAQSNQYDSLDYFYDESQKVRGAARDSLLRLAISKADEAGRFADKMRLYHLISFSYQIKNEYQIAKAYGLYAVQEGLKHPELQEKVSYRDALTNLTLCYSILNNMDSTNYFIKYTSELCNSADDKFNLSIITTLNAINNRESSYHNTILKFDSAISLASQTESLHDDVMSIFNKAEFLQEKRDFAQSLQLLTSTFDFTANPESYFVKNDPRKRVEFQYRSVRQNVFRILSLTYFHLSDIENAIYYQERFVDDYKKQGNIYLPYPLIILAQYESFKNNLGRVQHLYDTCNILIRKNYKSGFVSPAYYYVSGWLKEKNGEFRKAIPFYKKAIVYEINDPYSIKAGVSSLLRVYVHLNEMKLADSLVRVSSNILTDKIRFPAMQYSYELAGYYRTKGDFKKADEMMLMNNHLKDSLSILSRYNTIKEVETRFKVQEKENELALVNQIKALQEIELDRKNKETIFLVAGILILSAILLFLIHVYRSRNHQAKQLAEKNYQIETLIRELHHRVKNNMQTISSLLSLQSYRVSDESAKAALKEGQARVEAMSLIHQKLYRVDDLRGVNMIEYLNSLVGSLAQSYGYDPSLVKREIDLDKNTLDVDVAIPLGLIINELIVNSFKYAFEQVDKPELIINLKMNENNKLELMVRDNGIGLPEAFEKSSSFGLKLVKTLTKQLKGNLFIGNDNGAIFRVELNGIG